MSTSDPVRQSIEAIWRMESMRLIGGLLRQTRDIDLAEDLAQEALLQALETWPTDGIPDNPGAWLMAVAKHRAIDLARQSTARASKLEHLRNESLISEPFDAESAGQTSSDDDVLRLIIACCHPILAADARVALALRLLGGLTTREIASSYFVPEPTISQRIVRAKRVLREARVPFTTPIEEDLHSRLPSVLEVIYLIFNEGYAATEGDDWIRPELCEEAIRLGRILTALRPEAEAFGLLALMELQASRAKARVDSSGVPVLLNDQDRTRWDSLLIHRGLNSLARAEALSTPLGPYTIQASIAACHARAKSPEQTDWARIVALYDALCELTPSPIIELNRAVAVAMAFGAALGLQIVDAIREDPVLAQSALVPAVRGDLLGRLGRTAEARVEFTRAAAMSKHPREKELLLRRAVTCGSGFTC